MNLRLLVCSPRSGFPPHLYRNLSGYIFKEVYYWGGVQVRGRAGWDLETGILELRDPSVALELYLAHFIGVGWVIAEYGRLFCDMRLGAVHKYPRIPCPTISKISNERSYTLATSNHCAVYDMEFSTSRLGHCFVDWGW